MRTKSSSYPSSNEVKVEASSSKASDRTDVALEITSTVLTTLQLVAAVASPIPGLQAAAKLASNIITTVQKVKGNKDGFEMLATDAGELVYVIFRKNEDVKEDVPLGLGKNLEEVLKVLLEIERFAQNGTSRNKFSAFLLAGLDAGKIQEYRQKLQQCLSRFGFQTEIELQVMVHRLVVQQKRLLAALGNKNNAELAGVSMDLDGSSLGSRPFSISKPGSLDSSSGNVSYAKGSAETNSTYSGTTRTSRRIEDETANANADHEGKAINDNSVHFGQGVSFKGAYGFNVGGSPTVNWHMGSTIIEC